MRSQKADAITGEPGLAVQIFLYFVCAIWTGLVIPFSEIFFGMPTYQDPDVFTESNWLSSLFNLVIVVSGIVLFAVTFLN